MIAACAALLCHGVMDLCQWLNTFFESDRSSPGFPLKCKTWPFSWIFYKSRLSDEIGRQVNVPRTIRRHCTLAELSERHCALAELRASRNFLADVEVSIQVGGPFGLKACACREGNGADVCLPRTGSSEGDVENWFVRG